MPCAWRKLIILSFSWVLAPGRSPTCCLEKAYTHVKEINPSPPPHCSFCQPICFLIPLNSFMPLHLVPFLPPTSFGCCLRYAASCRYRSGHEIALHSSLPFSISSYHRTTVPYMPSSLLYLLLSSLLFSSLPSTPPFSLSHTLSPLFQLLP